MAYRDYRGQPVVEFIYPSVVGPIRIGIVDYNSCRVRSDNLEVNGVAIEFDAELWRRNGWKQSVFSMWFRRKDFRLTRRDVSHVAANKIRNIVVAYLVDYAKQNDHVFRQVQDQLDGKTAKTREPLIITVTF